MSLIKNNYFKPIRIVFTFEKLDSACLMQFNFIMRLYLSNLYLHYQFKIPRMYYIGKKLCYFTGIFHYIGKSYLLFQTVISLILTLRLSFFWSSSAAAIVWKGQSDGPLAMTKTAVGLLPSICLMASLNPAAASRPLPSTFAYKSEQLFSNFISQDQSF